VLPFPDLRQERTRAGFFKEIRPLMDALTPEVIAADGAAYLDALGAVAGDTVAITGYCMGARVGFRIAAAHPDRVAALAGFHGGGLVTDDARSPHRSAGDMPAEVYFGHADEDRSNTPEQIAALDAALADAGVTHRSEVYAGAHHGYTMSDTPVYDEAACERHFAALFDLLDRRGVLTRRPRGALQ
jgi:carboxymethylenebutenolidase